MPSDFISLHIINKIKKEIGHKHSILNHDGFYILDTPVVDHNFTISRTIDRFKCYSIFYSEPFIRNEILSISWNGLNGKTLLSILNKFRNNEFYIYKKFLEGEDMTYKKFRIDDQISG